MVLTFQRHCLWLNAIKLRPTVYKCIYTWSSNRKPLSSESDALPQNQYPSILNILECLMFDPLPRYTSCTFSFKKQQKTKMSQYRSFKGNIQKLIKNTFILCLLVTFVLGTCLSNTKPKYTYRLKRYGTVFE